MYNLFVNILKPYHGFGDEIVYVNKLLQKKQKIFKNKFVNVFELFTPFRPNATEFTQYFNKKNLLENSSYEIYYSKQLTDNDLDQSLWYTNKLENNPNKLQQVDANVIFRLIESRFFTKEKLNVRYIHLDLFSEKNWEAIVLHNQNLQVFTKNAHNNLDIEIVDIINFLHNSFQQRFTYINDRWKINFNTEDQGFLQNKNIVIENHIYDSTPLLLEYMESQNKNNNVCITQTGYVNQFLIKSDNKNSFLDYGDVHNDIMASYNALRHQYLYANYCKGLYKKDISWIKEDIEKIGFTVDYIPRYDHLTSDYKKSFSLRQATNDILSSKFAIGSEGGHMHVALYGGVPFLFVIPDKIINHFDAKNLSNKKFARPEITMLKFMLAIIIDRYPLSKLFFTTEYDLDNNLKDTICKMNDTVDLLLNTNYSYSENFFNLHVITNNQRYYHNITCVYKSIISEYLENDKSMYLHR